MTAQYTYDNNGNPIGVFLPIEDWNTLKSKYNDFNATDELPQWQKDILDARYKDINDRTQHIPLQSLLQELDVMNNDNV